MHELCRTARGSEWVDSFLEMNSKQKKVLIIGAVVVLLMLLFPPWDYFDPDSSARIDAGYHFFLTPPVPKPAILRNVVRFPDIVRTEKNYFRLILQLLITVPTIIGLAFLFHSKR